MKLDKKITDSVDSNLNIAIENLKKLNTKYYKDQINIATNLSIKALKNGKKIIFCGNGGSAADSQHLCKKIKIGLIQSKSLGTIQSNIDLAIKNIKKAANRKAKIICLPELFLTNYFCQTESHSNFKLAEKIPGKISGIFCDLAKELGVVLNITMF